MRGMTVGAVRTVCAVDDMRVASTRRSVLRVGAVTAAIGRYSVDEAAAAAAATSVTVASTVVTSARRKAARR